MKKIAIFFIITILIVCAIFAMYISYKANYNMSKKSNLAFEKYLNEEVYGTDLATVINRAVDRIYFVATDVQFSRNIEEGR